MLATVRRDDTDEATMLQQRVGHLGIDQHLAPSVLHRGSECRDQRSRVNRRFVRRMDARGTSRSEPGLERATFAAAEPLHPDVKGLHQLEPAPKLLRLVAVERDMERAAGVVADIELTVRRQLGCELRPRPRGGGRHLHQSVLAPVRLAHGCQHAGGNP